MRPKSVRLRENSLSSDEASKSELEALKSAKARQDISHQNLDEFIAAALAELNHGDRTPSRLPLNRLRQGGSRSR
jgi:hypothetical protein